jgi:carnitine O-palmitoyltransferase 2
MTFKDDPVDAKNTQSARTSSLITASIGFYRTLRDEMLEPDVFHTKPEKSEAMWFKKLAAATPRKLSWFVGFAFGAYALDMSQYKNLFHSTRIPVAGKDELLLSPDSKHIVIQRGSHFYAVDVLDSAGNMIDPAVVAGHVEAICKQPIVKTNPLGVLTTMNRDEWAKVRKQLIVDPVNAKSLHLIDSALFAVTLEVCSEGKQRQRRKKTKK